MKVAVTLPPLLSTAIGARTLSIDASTVADAVAQLRAHARLGPLIFDDAGALRPHVLIFHNETATRWLGSLDVPVREGDSLAVIQAISGG